MGKVDINHEMRFVATKAVVYRAARLLSASELKQLNDWLQEQVDDDFGSIAMSIDAITFTGKRPTRPLMITFTNPASTQLVKRSIEMIARWVEKV